MIRIPIIPAVWGYGSRMDRQQGYTLIELLLYITVLGGLLVAVTAFFGTMVESRVKNQSIAEVEQQGALAMDLITQTLRNANTISSPAAGASGSSLTVTVPTGSLSPTIFDLSSGVLRVKEGAATAVPLTDSKVQVTNLTITNLTRSGTNGIVQISMTLSRVNTVSRNEYDYTKTFITSAELRE